MWLIRGWEGEHTWESSNTENNALNQNIDYWNNSQEVLFDTQASTLLFFSSFLTLPCFQVGNQRTKSKEAGNVLTSCRSTWRVQSLLCTLSQKGEEKKRNDQTGVQGNERAHGTLLWSPSLSLTLNYNTKDFLSPHETPSSYPPNQSQTPQTVWPRSPARSPDRP